MNKKTGYHDSRRRSSAKINANLEFDSSGYLRAVYLNCQTDGDQTTLERALYRLLKPGHFSWIRRLFRWE